MLRIPLKGGDEYDALTKGGRKVHEFRAGERAKVKQGYWRRFRKMVKGLIKKEDK